MYKRKTFAERLKGLRTEKKMTIVDLAKDLGISSVSLGYYEREERVPDIEVLEKICSYFNVTSDFLLGRAECPTPDNEAISKVTGLSEKAINKLIKMNGSFDGLSYNDEVIFGLDGLPSINLLLEDDSDILTLINQYLFSAFEIGFNIYGVRAEGMPPVKAGMKDVTGFSISVPVKNKDGYYDAMSEDVDPNILRYLFLKQIENRLAILMEKNKKNMEAEYYGKRNETGE